MNLMMSISRRKKKAKKSKSANDRSLMLKTVMPLLSGDRGDSLAKAIKALDDSTVKKVMDQITSTMVNKIQKQKEAMGVKD